MRAVSGTSRSSHGSFWQRSFSCFGRWSAESTTTRSFSGGASPGGGHFSPIGGYHAPSDRVLVMDAGVVAELAPPDELRQREGSIFGRLWQAAQHD